MKPPGAIIAFAVGLALAVPSGVRADGFGRYVGVVQAQWDSDGRKMHLLSRFEYFDPKGVDWLAPAGSTIDGASIPQFAWSIIGGPFEGKYRDASVLHDVACDEATRPWEDVHLMFYWAMRESKVEDWRAKIMYAAVYYFGPRWPQHVLVRDLPATQEPVAKQRALLGATPGSAAKVLRVVKHDRTWTDVLLLHEAKADFEVAVIPPTNRLSTTDFEQLEQALSVKSDSVSGGLSLEEIRRFHPTAPAPTH